MAFNPNEHLTGLPRQQKKSDGSYETVKDDYLEVKWRLVWFREQCPQGSIMTEEVFVDLDREVIVEATRWVDDPSRQGKKKKETYNKVAKGYARYRAIVKDGNGAEATGTKTESAVDFPDFCEKAETGAIGRALAALGFGTQFTGDEFNEKHRIVDSPVKNDAEPESANTHPVATNVAPRPQQQTNKAQPTPLIADPKLDTNGKASQVKVDAPPIDRIKASAQRVLGEGGYASLKGTMIGKYDLGDIADADIPANIRLEMADMLREEAAKKPHVAKAS